MQENAAILTSFYLNSHWKTNFYFIFKLDMRFINLVMYSIISRPVFNYFLDMQ